MERVAIATGGTGGHVYAAVAIAGAFKRSGTEPFIMHPAGDRSEGFIEEEKAEEGFELAVLPAMRGAGLRNSASGLIEQTRAAIDVFDDRAPSALIVVGGYPVVGPGVAARIKGVPLFVYEQNAVAGCANRLLSFWARRLLVNVPAERLVRGQVVVGHPVRERLLKAAREAGNHTGSPRRLLIVGGSQGARSLDETLVSLYPLIKSRFPGWRLMHLTGPDLMKKAQDAFRSVWGNPVAPDGVFGFRRDMETLYLNADAAVSRAGAMAAAELSLFGTPTIFVPYPFAAAEHQQANAAYFQKQQAALVVNEGPVFRERFWGALIGLLSDEEARRTLRRRFEKVSPANDGAPLADAVFSSLGGEVDR